MVRNIFNLKCARTPNSYTTELKRKQAGGGKMNNTLTLLWQHVVNAFIGLPISERYCMVVER